MPKCNKVIYIMCIQNNRQCTNHKTDKGTFSLKKCKANFLPILSTWLHFKPCACLMYQAFLANLFFILGTRAANREKSTPGCSPQFTKINRL